MSCPETIPDAVPASAGTTVGRVGPRRGWGPESVPGPDGSAG